MSIDWWINKEDDENNRILFSYKKRMNNAICSNKDAVRGYHTKWNKSERERQLPCDITYMWNLKYSTNEPIYKTETDSQTQRTDLWLWRGSGEKERDTQGIRGYYMQTTALHLEQINNQILLYGTGNYIQSPGINHNGKEYKKECIYVYSWVTLIYSRH